MKTRMVWPEVRPYLEVTLEPTDEVVFEVTDGEGVVWACPAKYEGGKFHYEFTRDMYVTHVRTTVNGETVGQQSFSRVFADNDSMTLDMPTVAVVEER